MRALETSGDEPGDTEEVEEPQAQRVAFLGVGSGGKKFEEHIEGSGCVTKPRKVRRHERPGRQRSAHRRHARRTHAGQVRLRVLVARVQLDDALPQGDRLVQASLFFGSQRSLVLGGNRRRGVFGGDGDARVNAHLGRRPRAPGRTTGSTCSLEAPPWKSGTGRPPTRATTVGTVWIWKAWVMAGALSISTSTSWKAPACSRVISSSMASAGFDSSERGDHMTMMTGTAWEVDMTSWKCSSSVVVMRGMWSPSPAAGEAVLRGTGSALTGREVDGSVRVCGHGRSSQMRGEGQAWSWCPLRQNSWC